MDVVLYYAPNACSLVPYVTLTEAGATFEVKKLNLGKNQQNSADYLKLNPKHKVPLLIVDGRRTLRKRRDPGLDRPQLSRREAAAIKFVARTSSDLDPGMVRIGNSPISLSDQLDTKGLRPAECRPKRAEAGARTAVRELQDRRKHAGRSRILLRPFHGG